MNFITSAPIQIAWQASRRKHNTCHICAFDLLVMTSFHTPALPFPCLKQQSESIAAAPGKREEVRASWRANRTGRQEKHNPSLPVCTQLLDQLSSQASREEGGLSALSSSLADEKQCALFHYTVNPISCFTLCRRVAERGNEWDGMGKCWHKSHSPRGDTSRSSGYSWRILSN